MTALAQKFAPFLLIFILGHFLAAPALALNLGGGDTGSTWQAADKAGYDKAGETTLAETAGKIIKIVLSVVGVIFTALMVYAGILWMTARGDESKVEKAKDIIEASIIGLVIALASYGLTSFVVNNVLDQTAPSPAAPEPVPEPGAGGAGE